MKKGIFTILIILICVLSISTVSADDDTPVEDVAAIADAGSFTELNNKIYSATGSVELDKNYTYSSSTDSSISTIYIKKNLTIDGKGHTINASNKVFVFHISKNFILTIKNITFINGKSVDNSPGWNNGGTIHNEGYLNVINCDFINNSASNWGGAICNNRGYLNVINCDFINNFAIYSGGAICNYLGYLNVNGSGFSNNSAANGSGGAIWDNGGYLNVSGCGFSNNSANNGGAICSGGYLNVDDCDFINNSASNWGGAIYNDNELTVDGSILSNNSAKSGGAIYNNRNLNVNGSNFSNNSASNFGGAIYNNKDLNVGGCNFSNNSANKGSAIYNNKNLDVNSSGFIDNSAADQGGAIFNNRNLNVNGSGFSNNSAKSGGAIYNYLGYLNVSRCSFSNNSASKLGGAIYNSGEDLNVSVCDAGGCDFIDNSATDQGGAIYNDGNLDVNSGSFIDNSANVGGAICNNRDLDVNGGSFIDNSANVGGAICNNRDLDVNGSGFSNNSANESGGAIYNNKDLNVNGSGFSNNSASNFGGSIYNNKDLDVCDCDFSNNSANKGSAIYNNKNLNVDDCDFRDNSATDQGGAIFNNRNLNVNGSGFSNNSAKSGGAIYNYLGYLNVSRCGFSNNSASKLGGAIYNSGEDLNVSVCDAGGCDFIDNSATDQGGAIYNDGNLDVNSGSFIDNSANVGGAICNNRDLNVNGSGFSNNSASNLGGAIYNDNKLTVDCSTFSNNSAIDGGAIFNNRTLDVIGGGFSNNSAANWGGAIYDDDKLTVDSSSFTNNTATIGADIVINIDKNLTLENSTANITFITIMKLNKVNNVNATENATISGTVSSKANGTVTITVNGNIVADNVTVENGNFNTLIQKLPAGTYNATVAFKGENFTDCNATTNNFIITKASTSINVSDINGIAGDVVINGVVTGIPEGAVIKVTVGSATANTTVNGSKFSVVVEDLAAGNYTIKADYAGDGFYASANATAKLSLAQIATCITINDLNIFVGQNATIVGAVAGIPEGAVIKVTVGNTSVITKVKGSKFSVTVEDLTIGSYNIVAVYGGTIKYESTSASATLTVSKLIPTVTTIVGIADVLDASDILIVNATVTSEDKPVNGTVELYINGKYIAKEDAINGKVSLNTTLYDVGKVTVMVKFSGDYKYGESNDTHDITVKDTNVNLTVPDVTLFFKNGTQLVIYLTTSNGTNISNENVTINLNGIDYTKTVINGTAKLSIDLAPGTYNATVSLVSEKYSSLSTHATVTILPVIKGNDTVLYFKNGTQYVALFLYGEGKPLKGANVEFNINGVIYKRITNANGTANLTINLPPGNYIITVKNKDNGALHANNITVLPVIKGNDTVLYFKNGTQYVTLFLDGKGNPLTSADVEFNINGVFYNKTSDKNGIIGLDINLAPGKYIVTVKNKDNGALHANNITVLPVIKGNDTVLYFKNGTQYVTLFLDGKGNPLTGADVEFNINGVFYNKTSDKKGIVGLDINLAPGEYIVTVKNKDNGALHANNITVLPTILSENIVKYYKNETQYVVKVVDGKGNDLANQTVEYNINGVFYNKTTDANGTAVFNINLGAGNSEPKDYIVTAWCNGCIVSNNVTVLPVLTAEDFTEPFQAGKKFTAKIVDGEGKPLEGAKIQFNINGVFYNKTSDVNGTVGLNINLAPGEYIITSLCVDNGAIISNKVTITPKV